MPGGERFQNLNALADDLHAGHQPSRAHHGDIAIGSQPLHGFSAEVSVFGQVQQLLIAMRRQRGQWHLHRALGGGQGQAHLELLAGQQGATGGRFGAQPQALADGIGIGANGDHVRAAAVGQGDFLSRRQ